MNNQESALLGTITSHLSNGDALHCEHRRVVWIRHHGATRKTQHIVTKTEEALVDIIRHLQAELHATDRYRSSLALGEPYFLLKGRDPQAPLLVERWAAERAAMDRHSDKPQEAYKIASEMRLYKLIHPELGTAKSKMLSVSNKLAFEADLLLGYAKANEKVLRIETTPRYPLAQGNFDMAVSISAANIAYRRTEKA